MMDENKQKDLREQIVCGLLTVMFGIICAVYGWCVLTGKIERDINTALFLLGGLVVTSILCGVLTIKNYRKYHGRR